MGSIASKTIGKAFLPIMAAVACGAIMPAAAHAADNTSTIYPPWSHGKNNPVIVRGLEFTVPEVDNLPDFHGNPIEPKLSIFVGGNYYFAMAPLVAAYNDPDYLAVRHGLGDGGYRGSSK